MTGSVPGLGRNWHRRAFQENHVVCEADVGETAVEIKRSPLPPIEVPLNRCGFGLHDVPHRGERLKAPLPTSSGNRIDAIYRLHRLRVEAAVIAEWLAVHKKVHFIPSSDSEGPTRRVTLRRSASKSSCRIRAIPLSAMSEIKNKGTH